MKGTGLVPQDYAQDDVELWPENLPVFDLFRDMQTQWRVAMGGATGLDYPALMVLMDVHGVPPDERRQWLADIQVMEAAALAEMNKTFD